MARLLAGTAGLFARMIRFQWRITELFTGTARLFAR